MSYTWLLRPTVLVVLMYFSLQQSMHIFNKWVMNTRVCCHNILFQFRFHKILVATKALNIKKMLFSSVSNANILTPLLVSQQQLAMLVSSGQVVFASLLRIYFLLSKSLDLIDHDQLLLGFDVSLRSPISLFQGLP